MPTYQLCLIIIIFVSYTHTGADVEITLASSSVSVGGLLVLNCTVTGVTEVYNFTWFHNGEVRLQRNSPYTAIIHDGLVSTLTIHDIPSDEAGIYTCIARISNTIILQDNYVLALQCKLYICTHTHTNMHTHIYTHNIHTYMHTYIHTHACTHVHTCTHIIYTHAHTYSYTYIHTHAHTHAHTRYLHWTI